MAYFDGILTSRRWREGAAVKEADTLALLGGRSSVSWD